MPQTYEVRAGRSKNATQISPYILWVTWLVWLFFLVPTAIRRAISGERVVDPGLAIAALSEGTNPLTERSRSVVAAATQGASTAEIAATLYLSEGTVRNYLSVAIQKLRARNRVEAAHIAERKGWL